MKKENVKEIIMCGRHIKLGDEVIVALGSLRGAITRGSVVEICSFFEGGWAWPYKGPRAKLNNGWYFYDGDKILEHIIKIKDY